MPDLVLASTSPYRKAQLEQLGLSFRCRAPKVDEDVLKAAFGGPPIDLARSLAIAKAVSLGTDEPDAIVIGGDQVVAFEGMILGKPGTLEMAIEQLTAMSAKSHELISAVAVWHQGRIRDHVITTRLRIRGLDRLEIERIVLADQSWDCAGGYKVEGRGISLFEEIDTRDPSAIIGLPMIGLITILKEIEETHPRMSLFD